MRPFVLESERKPSPKRLTKQSTARRRASGKPVIARQKNDAHTEHEQGNT